MDFRFTSEQQELQKKITEFAQDKIAPIATEWEESNNVRWDFIKILAENDILRYVVPKEHGGFGINSTNVCIIREELARICYKADESFICQGLGSYPITCYGTEAQKKKYLPAVANGEKLISFCLSEPAAGSDVAGIQTTAVPQGDSWILNGEKSFVANPEDAAFFTVFAKTDSEKGAKGISAFVLERGQSDFGAISEKIIYPSPIGRIVLENCRIPKENLLGDVGQGMRIALNNLNVFRKSVGASVVGLARAALELAIAYAKKRSMFGQKLVDFQATQFKLADMATEIDAAKLLVYRAAWMSDNIPVDSRKESSMAKLYATEMAQRVVDQAVQIFGGLGVYRSQRIEFLYRCVRINRIVEGTSEIQKLTIARELLKD
jgi:acyl-CoA dehydrogenase